MRRMMVSTAMALVAAGCVGSPPPGSAPGQAYRPLDAYIMSPDEGLRFHVSRPAYVALFEIVPGQGTRMLYPAPGYGRMDGYIHAGDRVLRSRGFRGSQYSLTGGPGGRGAAGEPRFLYLIASERPLRLEQFGPAGYGLRQTVGFRSYGSPYAAMERLAELSLPSLIDDGSWTTDFYVFWPQVLHDRGVSRDVMVRCNGYQMMVPYEFVLLVQREICGRRVDEAPEEPRPSEPEPDSMQIERPGRRAPLPHGGEQGRARVINSRQLQQPQSRAPESRPLERGRIAVDSEEGSGEGVSGQPERERVRPTAPAAEPRSNPAPGRERAPASRPAASPAPAPAPVRPADQPAARPVREGTPAPAPERSTGKKCDPCAMR